MTPDGTVRGAGGCDGEISRETALPAPHRQAMRPHLGAVASHTVRPSPHAVAELRAGAVHAARCEQAWLASHVAEELLPTGGRLMG